MLGITEECIDLTERTEAARCGGADEAKFFGIVIDHSFGGRKTMFS